MTPTAPLDMLSDSEWLAIIRGDEDGPWPPCCGNVSQVRGALTDLAVGHGDDRIRRVARLMERELSEHLDIGDDMVDVAPASTVRLRDMAVALIAQLDAATPDWRQQMDAQEAEGQAERIADRCTAQALSHHGAVAMVDDLGWIEILADSLVDLLGDPERCAAVLTDRQRYIDDTLAYLAARNPD